MSYSDTLKIDLKITMNKKNLTQKGLANKMNIDPAQVSRYFTGKEPITDYVLRGFCYALKLEFEEIDKQYKLCKEVKVCDKEIFNNIKTMTIAAGGVTLAGIALLTYIKSNCKTKKLPTNLL